VLSRSRLQGAVRAFERRSLRLLGVLGLVLLAVGVAVQPTSTPGAVLVSIGTSLIAAVVVAAFALEREAFAQALFDLGVNHVFRDRKRDFDDEFWTGLVKETRDHYRVLGTANHGYWWDEQTREDTRTTLRDAIVKRKVEVEFLFLKPDSELCRHRDAEEKRNTAKDMLVSLKYFWQFRESLPEPDRGRLTLKEYEATPSCGITWADDTLVVTHYLAGRNNLGSPGLLLRTGRTTMDTLFRPVSTEERPAPLSDVYLRNYREIASTAKSSVITPDRYAVLQRKLEAMGDQPSISEADLRTQDDDD
jgi:hypothetical protein